MLNSSSVCNTYPANALLKPHQQAPVIVCVPLPEREDQEMVRPAPGNNPQECKVPGGPLLTFERPPACIAGTRF
jgi:hypothetical protein